VHQTAFLHAKYAMGAESTFLARFVQHAFLLAKYVTQRAFYQMSFSVGLYQLLKRKSVYPPPMKAEVLGHLI
jgi:hypothetical protein